MLRLSTSAVSKAGVPFTTRALHNTTLDAVKLAEVREVVHAKSKAPEPHLQISSIPLSKIAKEIKATNNREAAQVRALGNDMEFRQVHGQVRDLYYPSSMLKSPILATVLASTATATANTPITQTRTMAYSAAIPFNSTAQTRMMANRAAIAQRVQAGIASGRCVADLDSAFGL